MYKATIPTMIFSKQLFQKCFSKKNKLNLTENLEGIFTIKPMCSKKQREVRERDWDIHIQTFMNPERN